MARPAATMAAYCAAVGLPFSPQALAWEQGERPEWRRSARWHTDASASSGFERREHLYQHTVENSDKLARYAAHHRPFYEKLHAQRLDVTPLERPSTPQVGRTRVTSAGAITETTLFAATDAGMHALWNPFRFTGITDYPTWENALLDDENITQRVQAGDLVPINIGHDGAWQFLVRVGARGHVPVLTSRERQYLLVSSRPYRYLSDDTAHLTGIERIHADPGPEAPSLTVPAGPHAVTVHLIEWDAEPGAKDAQGKPTLGALPDFVLLISPEDTMDRTVPTAPGCRPSKAINTESAAPSRTGHEVPR